MKITKRQLRRIIKESILAEQEMISIVRNDYEDVEDINILANYALRNDMQGALRDPELQYYIDKNETGYLVDDSYGWLKHVGDEVSYNMPAPEGWDLKKVYQFFKDFEDEAYRVFINKEKGDHANLPNKLEREIIGGALNQSYIMPDEIEDIAFQIRRKGGKPMNINIEDDNIVSNINHEEATRNGLTLDDIVKVLRDGGAKERKKQKPIKHTPPIYD